MITTKAVPREVFCPECGALNSGPQDRCWLCYRDLPLDAEIIDAPPKHGMHTSTDVSRQPITVIASVATLVLVLLVGVGAFATDQVLGIAYVVVVTPALLVSFITFAINQRRHGAVNQDRPLKAGLASFFISLGAMLMLTLGALALAVVLAVAAMIALIVQCFQALEGHP